MEKHLKILVIGKDNVMKWPQNVQEAFDALGYETRLFLFNRRNLAKSFFRRVNREKYCAILLKEMKSILESFAPDIVVLPFVFFVPNIVFDNLPAESIKVGWCGDRFQAIDKERADKLDFLFFTDTGYLEESKKFNFSCHVGYLPHAFNSRIFFNRNMDVRSMNAFFVGIPNARRVEILSGVKEQCIVYGKRWDKKFLKSHIVKNLRIPHEKLPDYYNDTRVAITINAPENNIYGMNMRIFEASACGCLIATDAVGDLSKCYAKDEVAVYETAEELEEIIIKAASGDIEMRTIAEKGYKRTVSNHSYKTRMSQLLNMAFSPRTISEYFKDLY